MTTQIQLVVLGPGGVGKTKSATRFMDIMSKRYELVTSEIKPWNETMVVTSNFVLHNVEYPKYFFEGIGDGINLSLYDMGGQFRYKSMWEALAEHTDGIIGVVDITRSHTLKQIPLMLPEKITKGLPIRLVINKADLYAEFASKSVDIGSQIFDILQNTASIGFVNYMVVYKGTHQFYYNNRNYTYGDSIPIFKKLHKDEEGDTSIEITDFEVIIKTAFTDNLVDLTEHNGNLFAREFLLQIIELLRNQGKSNKRESLPDELIIATHKDAPPFMTFGGMIQGVIPGINLISREMCVEATINMLVQESDIISMLDRLEGMGYKIHSNRTQSFQFTSAELLDEDPLLEYQPVSKAFIPLDFIRDVVNYTEGKYSDDEENYFI